MKLKNAVKRGLIGAVALTTLLGSTVVTHAKGWSTTVTITVLDNIYDIDLKYELDDENETPNRKPLDISGLDVPTHATQKKSGSVYKMTPPEIDGKVYAGYEVIGKTENVVTSYKPGQKNPDSPAIQTDSRANDVNFKGLDYTVVLIYKDDANDNKVADQDEFYTISESYLDKTTGNVLKPSTLAVYDGNINYQFNNVDDLENLFIGYEYLGYSYKSTYGFSQGHEDGQDALLPGVPAFMMRSDAGKGTYDVNMYWQIDQDQWATLSYDPGTGVGTMDSQTELKGSTVTIKDNEFTNGNLIFVGWSIKNDNSYDEEDERYYAGSDFTLDKDTVLYAVWDRA